MEGSLPLNGTQGALGAWSSERRDRMLTWAAFLLTLATTATWLAVVPVKGAIGVASLMVVTAAHLLFVLLQRRSDAVSSRVILAGVALLVVVAVLLPPATSKDVWAYAAYGRVSGIEQVSAYTHPPSAYPSDPFLARMSPRFLNTPSVYGPVFTLVSGFGARVYGGSPLLARLYFQASAGAALLGAAWLLLRRGVASWIVALVIMTPGVLIVVNGGHLDLPVSVALVAALLLLDDEHHGFGGMALAFALLIKIVALPALGGVLVALLLRRQVRAAAVVAGTVATLVITSYLMVGGMDAVRPMSNASRYLSIGSIGRGLYRLGTTVDGPASDLAASAPARSMVALGLAVSAFAVFVWLRRDRAEVVTFAVGATLVYLLTTNYALAWYPLAVLPASALAGTRLRRGALATFALLQCADSRLLPLPIVTDHLWFIGPLAEVGILVAVVSHARSERRLSRNRNEHLLTATGS